MLLLDLVLVLLELTDELEDCDWSWSSELTLLEDDLWELDTELISEAISGI